MSNDKREAKFIGNLFINESKAGKPYGRGTLDIDGRIINIFGHFSEKPSKKDPSVSVRVFHIEDTTEADELKQAASVKLDNKSGAKGVKAKDYKLDF